MKELETDFVVIVAIILSLCVPAAFFDTTDYPTAVVGQTVTLPCKTTLETPVDWWFQASADEEVLRICESGVIIDGNDYKFSLSSAAKGVYNLVVSDVQLNDTGLYTCIEDAGLGNQHYFLLNVSEITAYLTAEAGQTVTLPCKTTLDTPVDWWFQLSEDDDVAWICQHGVIVSAYKERFKLASVTKGDYNLVISNVKTEDAGLYNCIENAGLGNEHYIALSVPESFTASTTTSLLTTTSVGSHPDLLIIEETDRLTTSSTTSPPAANRTVGRHIRQSVTENGKSTERQTSGEQRDSQEDLLKTSWPVIIAAVALSAVLLAVASTFFVFVWTRRRNRKRRRRQSGRNTTSERTSDSLLERES